MTPKPEQQPQNNQDQIPIDKSATTVQEAPVDSSDEDAAEEAGEGYQYHLVGQEPNAENEEEEEDDMSHLSIADQVQALVAQAQSQPQNLSPATQELLAESSERQEAELRREKAEIWAENKTSRDIDLSEEKVDAIKNIMKNFSLPSSSMPSYLARADQNDLTEKLKALKRN